MQPFKWQKYEYEYECEYEYEYECECEYDHLHAFGDETRKLWGGKNQGDITPTGQTYRSDGMVTLIDLY